MEAVAKLSIDASGSTQGADQYAAAASKILESDKLVRGTTSKSNDGGEKNNEKLFTSNLRVSSSIRMVAESLMMGGNAANVMGSAFLGLDRVLKGATIGQLAVLGVGAVLATQFAEAAQKAEELAMKIANLRELAGVQAGSDSISQLQQNYQAAAANRETVNAGRESSFGQVKNLGFAMYDVLTRGEGKSVRDYISDMTDVGGNSAAVMRNSVAGMARVSKENNAGLSVRYGQQFGEQEARRIEIDNRRRQEQADNQSKFGTLPGQGFLDLQHQVDVKAWYATDEVNRTEGAQAVQSKYAMASSGLGNATDEDKRKALDNQVQSAKELLAIDENDLTLKTKLAEASKALSDFDSATAFARSQELEQGAYRLEILKDELAGNDRLSKLVEQRAKFEAQIAQETRAGHAERAAQLRTEQVQTEAGQRFNDYGTMSASQIHHRLRTERRARLKREKQMERFTRNEGLIDVQRNAAGEVIGGIDPESGERVTHGKTGMDWDVQFHAHSGMQGTRLDRNLSLSPDSHGVIRSGTMLDMGTQISGGATLADLKKTMDTLVSIFSNS